MTGFGSEAFEAAGVGFEVEIRSVNHRYLDVRVKLPRLLSELEAAVRASVQERLARGKVEVAVTMRAGSHGAERLVVDSDTAAQYVAAARALSDAHDLADSLSLDGLLALPGVARFEEPELPLDALKPSLETAVHAAVDALDAMRVREGENLAAEILGRLDRVVTLSGEIEARAGEVAQAARERLRKRAEQLKEETGLLDEARLHQEIVIAADRLDVTEELVRLRSHVDQFREAVAAADSGQPAGRRLDFLMQEFGREVNTIGSKGSDAPIAHAVVELKTELERVREQVQNVE
ncbi:MAG: YicC family protein [Proteobacteria bacterium]|nr:YicC family protein [Pseudomonadota bacterium]